MDFLEKLDYLMEKNNLNKNTLSKACDIPYTTIDGWYKKGFEGLKLTTLRKLASFFGTSLDFWASEKPLADLSADDDIKQIARHYSRLGDSDRDLVKRIVCSLAEKSTTSEEKTE
jgi:plasmid maintenance system antidote protein VapI